LVCVDHPGGEPEPVEDEVRPDTQEVAVLPGCGLSLFAVRDDVTASGFSTLAHRTQLRGSRKAGPSTTAQAGVLYPVQELLRVDGGISTGAPVTGVPLAD